MIRMTALAVALTFALVACGGGGGTTEDVGTLVGFKASMDLDQTVSGEVDSMDFGGVLVLELDDGTQIEALAAGSFVADGLTGGDQYRVELNEDTEIWTVLELLGS